MQVSFWLQPGGSSSVDPWLHSGLTGKSLSAVKWELVKPTRRPSVFLVPETGFVWTPHVLVSNKPLLSLRCSAAAGHFLRLSVRVVDWCVSLLVRLFCCQFILTASSPGRQLICRSFAICLLVLPPLPSGRERSGVSCLTRKLMVHWPIRYVLSFLKRTADVMAPRLSVVFLRLVRRVVSELAGVRPMSPQLRNVTPVAGYLPIFITSELFKVFEPLRLLSWTIYGMQWCASDHPVCLSEMSGYRWCIFVCVSYTARCIGDWAGC